MLVNSKIKHKLINQRGLDGLQYLSGYDIGILFNQQNIANTCTALKSNYY